MLSEFLWQLIAIALQTWDETHRIILLIPSIAITCKGTLNVAKAQQKLRIACNLNLPWYGSMKWNMEENFSVELNMKCKIFSMKWKWNGRKLPVWNMEKSYSIPYHALKCNGLLIFN